MIAMSEDASKVMKMLQLSLCPAIKYKRLISEEEMNKRDTTILVSYAGVAMLHYHL